MQSHTFVSPFEHALSLDFLSVFLDFPLSETFSRFSLSTKMFSFAVRSWAEATGDKSWKREISLKCKRDRKKW